MRISPHLCFDGQCDEAFRTYHRILGGKITTMLRYGDSAMAEQVKPQWRNRIVHATLDLGDQQLLGADLFPDDYERPQGFFVTVSLGDLAKATELFKRRFPKAGPSRLHFQVNFLVSWVCQRACRSVWDWLGMRLNCESNGQA